MRRAARKAARALRVSPCCRCIVPSESCAFAELGQATAVARVIASEGDQSLLRLQVRAAAAVRGAPRTGSSSSTERHGLEGGMKGGGDEEAADAAVEAIAEGPVDEAAVGSLD